MGFFSWKTQDTNRSIANIYSDFPTFGISMIDDKGNVWREYDYEGYGVFGGKDYYELLAEMNGKSTREEGITIAFSGKPYLSPNLVEKHEDWKYQINPPEHCEFHGFFYGGDDEDDF
jgi:hypothetical protein